MTAVTRIIGSVIAVFILLASVLTLVAMAGFAALGFIGLIAIIGAVIYGVTTKIGGRRYD